MAKFRGLEEKHELGARQLARDTRPLGQRVADVFSNPTYMVVMMATASATIFVIPESFDFVTLYAICHYLYIRLQKPALPFRLPQSSGELDYNDLKAGTNIPNKAMGCAFIGNEIETNKELWFTNDDLRTHLLIFGSTGAGKTETLLSFAFNSLVQGSGFIYIDGKGDNSLYTKIYSMVRRMGRDDDLLLINFMTGARDVIGPQKTRLSNTMNPFAIGSSSMLSNLVVSLMGDSGGDGDMWKGRAIQFVDSLMKVLCAMRDEGFVLLDANLIRNYFQIEKLEMMVWDKRFPLNDKESIPIDSLPPIVFEALTSYVENLPGYQKSKKFNQAGEVREQHGFITMQLTRCFGSLADTYGHIVRTNLAEIDFKDVVLNRRIMVVLLPALEKSPEELSNLGKIIIASLKSMMAAGLGDNVEGEYKDVILKKPTNSPTPYVCIMDEYGYYAVKGFAVVPAQARSLGFCAVFAGQDLPAFQKASKEEAASIGANCNIKICMKLEDPTDTWDFFSKTAGETLATSVQSFQAGSGGLTNNYMDSRSANVEKRARIDLLDLKDQKPGEFHIFFKSRIVRGRAFYASPKPASRMQLNQQLCVEKLSELLIIDMTKRLRRFNQVFKEPRFVMDAAAPVTDITTIAETLAQHDNLKPFERGIAAVIGLLEKDIKAAQVAEEAEEVEKQEEFDNFVSAFSPVFVPDFAIPIIGEHYLEDFKNPLLTKSRTLDALVKMERFTGRTEVHANNIANELINDISNATAYPPSADFESDPDGVLTAIDHFITALTGKRRSDFMSSGDDSAASGSNSTELPDLSALNDIDFSEFPEFADLAKELNMPDNFDLNKMEELPNFESPHESDEDDEDDEDTDRGDEKTDK